MRQRLAEVDLGGRRATECLMRAEVRKAELDRGGESWAAEGRSRRNPSESFSVLHSHSIRAIEPFFPTAPNRCFAPSRRSFRRKTWPVKQRARSETKCAGRPCRRAALETNRAISRAEASFENTSADSGIRENASKATATLKVTKPNRPFTSVRSTIQT